MFIATALLTALATNNVAAVLVFPIALQAAQRHGRGPHALHRHADGRPPPPASPRLIGYQTNLMVFNVGGYRFSDFVRVGLPLTFLVGLVTVGVVPVAWPF